MLRKDFTVDARDVCDAGSMGADCVLLIAAALAHDELRVVHGARAEVGLDALVEVHDEPELERALAAGADLVGVNQRDLSPSRSTTLAPCAWPRAIPAGVVRVAESGISGERRCPLLAEAGYHAVLVGEHS